MALSLFAAALIVFAAWLVIAARQYDRLSDSAAGLLMCLTCGSGFIGALVLGINLIAPFLALTAMAFLATILWSFGYLR